MNFSEIRGINLPKCRIKSDFSSSLLYFLSPLLFSFLFFSLSLETQEQGTKAEVGEVSVRELREPISRDPDEIFKFRSKSWRKSATHWRTIESSLGMEMGIFSLFLCLFFLVKKNNHEVRETNHE